LLLIKPNLLKSVARATGRRQRRDDRAVGDRRLHPRGPSVPRQQRQTPTANETEDVSRTGKGFS
jgi:hypothetical protein